ncbi:AraC family transcriptional regulator [Brevibacillus sp. SYP-B805]|uniref:response regulator transcription factor n=1 Tax=Brevibacillus sp. SYP-B805 TaxID=1578199 RepID=UPI0013EA31FE|nr:helix-turn-helix domain-containing protein [Brevibacillus sp. SYP-B805]NGQ94851.1 AraC family transcriptional regulator [Brevibacillus sp. SYP-B805]
MNVLVAEKSDFQRNGLRWMLEQSGLAIERFTEAANAKDLFEQAFTGQHQLLLVDVDMLSHDDWKSMSEVAKTSVVIGITETKDFDLAIRCMEAGCYRLFVKPLAIQSFMEALQQVGETTARRPHAKEGAARREALKKEWVSTLIHGQVTNLREVWNQAIQLGYDALPSSVMVARISRLNELMANKSDAWRRQVLTQVFHTVQAFSQDTGMIATLIQDEFVLLYTPKKGEQKHELVENMKKLGLRLHQEVKAQTGYVLNIACGDEYKNPMLLYHSYEEAKRLLSLEFYFSSGRICAYADFPALFNKEIIEEIEVPFDEEEITRENLAFLFGELEKKLVRLKEGGVSPLYYKLTLMYVWLKMTKHFHYTEQEQFRSFLQKGELFLNCESADDLLAKWKGFMEELAENAVFSTHHLMIDRVLDFINANFHQPITLEQAAEHINRSPYYLSHLFKKVMNMTFVEYITHVRIKRAKELLLMDEYTISDIAASIGYQDPNYFSRVFKAICGVSPKKWKTQKKLETTRMARSGKGDVTTLQKVTTYHNSV